MTTTRSGIWQASRNEAKLFARLYRVQYWLLVRRKENEGRGATSDEPKKEEAGATREGRGGGGTKFCSSRSEAAVFPPRSGVARMVAAALPFPPFEISELTLPLARLLARTPAPTVSAVHLIPRKPVLQSLGPCLWPTFHNLNLKANSARRLSTSKSTFFFGAKYPGRRWRKRFSDLSIWYRVGVRAASRASGPINLWEKSCRKEHDENFLAPYGPNEALAPQNTCLLLMR